MGGAWKVAYADFVTAMMAFFLLLWVLSMVPPETRAGLAAYFSGDRNFDSSSTSPVSATDTTNATLRSNAFLRRRLVTNSAMRHPVYIRLSVTPYTQHFRRHLIT